MSNVFTSGPNLKPEAAALREAQAELTKDAKANWNDPEWRHAMAAELHEQVRWGFQHENLLDYFTQVESVENGDRIVIEEVFGLEVFWVGLGGNIDQSDITETAWEMKPDYIGFHVHLFDSTMRDQFGTKSTLLVNSAIQQMDAAISQRLIRTFQRAIPGPSGPYYRSAAGVNLSQIDAAITAVEDESFLGECAIVGRRTMIDKLMDAIRDSGQFLPVTAEQIQQDGYLGRYRGVPIIKLKNFRDRNKRSYFPANELLIVAKDASKVGFWGGLETREGSEPFGWYWHYLGRRAAGFAVWRPQACRRIVDTTQNP